MFSYWEGDGGVRRSRRLRNRRAQNGSLSNERKKSASKRTRTMKAKNTTPKRGSRSFRRKILHTARKQSRRGVQRSYRRKRVTSKCRRKPRISCVDMDECIFTRNGYCRNAKNKHTRNYVLKKLMKKRNMM